MSILIIGAGGLLGQELIGSYPNTSFISAPRNVLNKVDYLIEHRITTIMNLVASDPSANRVVSHQVNFEYPNGWLAAFMKLNHPKKLWIQTCSYFELQIAFGRRDPYTLEKSKFSKLLDTLNGTSGLKLSKIYLPYIFGIREKSNRIIPTLIRELSSNSTARLTSGTQYLPVLSAVDASRILFQLTLMNPGNYSATPEFYPSVKELAITVKTWIGTGKILFDDSKRSIDASYPRVSFPNPISLKHMVCPLESHIRSNTS